ncbi:MAG: hypothetical protein WD407_01015 [Rhodospirillales bacterium]
MRYSPDRTWCDFAAWCASRGLKALPAHPWTVAAYVRWCAPRHRLPAIIDSLKAITRMHLLKCHKTPERDPLVLKTLRRVETQAFAKETRAALFQAEDFAALVPEDAHTASNDEDRRAPPPEGSVAKRILRTTPRLVPRRAWRGST